uniref:TetR-like C-terminal domain-containing protein n=1 Tax=Bifidobacterium aesculapii TaxID=1329411 RepID=UPI000A986A5D
RIVDAMQRNMNRGPAAGETAPRYAARFWAGAICAVIEQWVRSDLDAPEEDLADVMTALMHHGVATAAKFGTGCAVTTP